MSPRPAPDLDLRRDQVIHAARGLAESNGWAAAGRAPLGWALIAAALTPTADALIVLTNRGRLAVALGIHGLTAGLLVAAGLVLALG